MPDSVCQVPEGTKLEIVYETLKVVSLTVTFEPDGGQPPIVLVQDSGDSRTGELIPFLRLQRSGLVRAKYQAVVIGEPVPFADLRFCASSHFMLRARLAAGGAKEYTLALTVTKES